MKFVLAPDKFKGSLTGQQFCEAVERGLRKVFPDANIVKKPLADGGDGTIDVVKHYLGASETKVVVNDPLFRKIEAGYLFSQKEKTAFIEMSEASGYKLLKKDEMNCMHTTSLGTGELILDALAKGAEEIILGIGGSATNDAGMGMAAALGYVFLDENDNVLSPVGKNLSLVKKISRDNVDLKLQNTTVKVACDVANPFYGPHGAAHVYAPQKGASNEEVALLDEGLQNFAGVLYNTFGIEVQHIPGAGAAGGMGGGAIAFLNAMLASGIDLIKEIADFDAVVQDADWIITGEGKLDSQTFSGKTIAGVMASAKKYGKPVAALCGATDLGMEQQELLGIAYIDVLLKNGITLEKAFNSSFELLEELAYDFAKSLV